MRAVSCSARELADLAADVTARAASVSFVVRGSSMSPALRTGDRVVIAAAEPGALSPGEIVLIGGERPRVHRVVRVDLDAGRIVTRGDTLAQDDPPAPLADVVGRVVSVDRKLGARVRAWLGYCKRRATMWLPSRTMR